MSANLSTDIESPFAPEQSPYLRWRERKLAGYPRRVEDLIVEVRDPRALRDSEVAEIRRLCHAANMAIYASSIAVATDRDVVRRLGQRLGLARMQVNLLADDDGISSLQAAPAKSARGYIPYSNQRLLWHTDGYYNSVDQSIRAFILHCVRAAASGGEIRLLDHEIAYVLLRDADLDYVTALSAPRAMTIPANEEAGAPPRPARSGPVFSSDGGRLHMRYTARTRSIEWAPDESTRGAVNYLHGILDADSPHVFAFRLGPGQGLVCNNVLHSRSAFTDDSEPGNGRLIYRARYSDRIAQDFA